MFTTRGRKLFKMPTPQVASEANQIGLPEGAAARKAGKPRDNPYVDQHGRPLRLFRKLYAGWNRGYDMQDKEMGHGT